MGMSVVSYTIKDISDDAGYLAALGMTRTAQVRLLSSYSSPSPPSIPFHSIRTFSLYSTILLLAHGFNLKLALARSGYERCTVLLRVQCVAVSVFTRLGSVVPCRRLQVKRDARVGEAEAKREAGIKQATANEERQAAKFQNDIEIAKSQRDYSAQQAIYDVEVNTKKAQADLAYKLQAAKLKQAIRAEELQVQVIERQQQILLQVRFRKSTSLSLESPHPYEEIA